MASLRAFYERSRGAPRSELDVATLFAILGHVVIPLFVLDRTGKVALWNAAVEKLTGLAASEVLGTKKHWRGFYLRERPCLADFVFKGDDADVRKLYAAHDEAGSDRSRMRAQNWCDLPKGERVYLLIDAGAIYDADGSIRYVVETLQDQTRIKQAEAAIEQTRDAQARDFDLVRETLGAGLDRVAKGDFSTPIETPLPLAAEALRNGFNLAVEGLSALLANVGESAGTLDDGANAIVASTSEATEQSRHQRAELDEAVRALNAITGTVKKNAASAERTRGIVTEAKAEAERSGVVVRSAIAAIHEIEKSSKEIGQIIGVIEEISFQTNLLALNAGVEAARAGESGRGFAVVASEVRALAQRSAAAAKQIKQLVEASDAQVSEGVGLVSGAGAALDSIGGEVARLNDAVGAIVREATEQAGTLQRVDTSMSGIGVAMARTTEIVENSASSAQELADEIARLRGVLGRFTIAAARTVAPLAAE